MISKEDILKTFFKAIGKELVKFVISVGCVALGWNVFLRFAFEGIYEIPVLGFGSLCLLTLAVSFVLQPLGMFVSDHIEQKLDTSLEALLKKFYKG